MLLNTFSCFCGSSECLWENASSGPLTIFSHIVCIFVTKLYKFLYTLILAPCQIYDWQIFSFQKSVADDFVISLYIKAFGFSGYGEQNFCSAQNMAGNDENNAGV